MDSGLNGKITYSLERGDRHQQFSIDANTGHLIVVRPLDREMVSVNFIRTFYVIYCTVLMHFIFEHCEIEI